MNTNSRITSVLKAAHLDDAITGLSTFYVSDLNLATDLQFDLPTNLRLGHMVEKIVSECIKSSSNYNVLYENIQIQKDKNTIGELDFIIQNIQTKQLIHLELAYKFYLFDPTISSELMHNWIGPNRKDSLKEKLDKLKKKQFPLLYNNETKSTLNNIEIENVSQQLCLLASLFIPYEYKGNFDTVYEKAIKGYYLDFETFLTLDHSAKMYHIPSKKEWGMNPSKNNIWTDFKSVEKDLYKKIQEKQAPLCWQKHNNVYKSFFIIWW